MERYQWRWEMPARKTVGAWWFTWTRALYDAQFHCKDQEFEMKRELVPNKNKG